MTQSTTPHPEPACPACGAPLHPDGTLLRCETHGLFFRYGPRLLVHVAHAEEREAVLMPWQTLEVAGEKRGEG
jgi:hypothetical protein